MESNDEIRKEEEKYNRHKKKYGEHDPVTLTMLNNLATLIHEKGDYKRALPLYEEGLAKRRQVLGENHLVTLQFMENLAHIFSSERDYDRALPLYQECLDKYKRILGEDHPYTLNTLNNLANLFLKMEEYDRALPLYEDCLAKYKRVLGEDDPKTKLLGITYSNLLRLTSRKNDTLNSVPSVGALPKTSRAEGGGTKKKDTSLERVRNLSGLSGPNLKVELEEGEVYWKNIYGKKF